MTKLKLPFELEKPSSNEYVTQASEIGFNGQPLDEVLSPLDSISKRSTQSEDEEFVASNDAGTDTYVKIGSYGMKSKDYLDLQGNSVILTKDTLIGETPSQTNVPTSKAVADYVDTHGINNLPISKELSQEEVEEVKFTNNAGNETYAGIGNYGLKVEKISDLKGQQFIDVDEDFRNKDEIEIRNTADTEAVMKISDDGLKVKSITDMDGNPIGGNPVHIAIEEIINVKVNGSKPCLDAQFSTTYEKNEAESDTEYTHTSKLWIPASTKKCKLIISFPGGGILPSSWYNYANHGAIFNSLGYALLIVTGYSGSWATAHNVTGMAPIGSWMALEEVTKAYQYIVDKYSAIIDTDCVLAYAESQGGMMAENALEQSGIPFKGGVLDVPAISMQYAQMYFSFREEAVYALYGLQNHIFDKKKCLGCDPFTRNMSEDIVMTEAADFSTLPTINVDTITAKKYRGTNTPLFILGGSQDTTISPDVPKAYAKAVCNAGLYCKYKSYKCGHGCVEGTNVIGTVNGTNCTAAMADVLDFFRRCGGYEYEIINN